MKGKKISLEKAKELALDYIKYLIFKRVHLDNIEPPYMSDTYLEEEACWMFFRNERIVFPPENWLLDCAVVVSKTGEVRGVVNYQSSPEEAKKYLKTMSEYFIQKQKNNDR